MFEILKAVETAKSEKNKLLRFFYLNYVKFKLKNTFFKRFDVYMLFNDIRNTRQLLGEIWQMTTCQGKCRVGLGLNSKTYHPYINYINNYTLAFDHIFICVNYYGFEIGLSINHDEFIVKVNWLHDDSSIESWTYTGPNLPYYIKEIIFMAIYNYCVGYIYGKESKLFKDDESYIENLKELF